MEITNMALLTGTIDLFQKNLNIIWMIFAGILVFFMQAGFAMIETGFTRAKSAGNIIMKNLMIYAIASLVFFWMGFAIMYGSDNPLIGAKGFFDAAGAESTSALSAFQSVSPGAFIFFQTVLCATAVTVVSGALAERTKFLVYLIFSAIISSIIYPVVGHWIWNSEGWLAGLGFHDFAGSAVVNSVGGWCALIGAAMVGPRVGKYTKEGKIYAIPGHNLVIGALGVFILWFAWFGFNTGSALEANKNLGDIAMTTNLSASASAVIALFVTWIRYGKPDISMTINGVLAGLAAISAGCDVVSNWGAVVIGALAGCVLVFFVEFVEKNLKIDDPVGASGVHLACGALGTVLTGILASKEYLEAAEMTRAQLIGVQVLGLAAVGAYVSVMAFLAFFVLKKTVKLRVSRQEEEMGLDISEHGTSSYPDFQIKL